MAFNVNEFRSQMVGDGARPNLFEVTMPFPTFSDPGDAQRKTTFMCRTAQLPGSTVGVVPVQYFGRELKFAGNRVFADWTITVINDEDFVVRNAFERWSNGINNMTDNEGLTNPVDYQVDAFVDHLDRNGNTIKSYTLRGAWPLNISEIALDYDEKTEIETFTVELQYQFYESNTTT